MKTQRVQKVYNEVNKLFYNALNDLSYDDKQLTDLDHFLEMGNCDASARAKIQKKRYEILNHRRQLKLEIADLKSIKDNVCNRRNKTNEYDIAKYDYRTSVISDIFNSKQM